MPVPWARAAEKAMKRQAGGPMPTYSPEYLAYTNAHGILSITGAFFGVAMFVVLCRCYVRITMLKVFGKDDYIMVLAMVCSSVIKKVGPLY